jgi:transcriptional regulator with GAF, ATPase, and Fis domain
VKPSGEAVSPELPGFTLHERVGAGAGGIVYRGRRDSDGQLAAVKVAIAATLAHEVEVLERAQRRWGPTLLASGEGWMATTWAEGVALDTRKLRGDEAAAIVAHGVARGLDELHRAGFRHGDVKPANIVVSARRPRRDRAEERGATLVDLDLARDVAEGALLGGTPAYLPPEHEMSPAADLFALGLVLNEMGATQSWAETLLARSPGARPSAAFIADAAARFLGLESDADEQIAERRARVRRTYLALRPRTDDARRSEIDPSIVAPARGWLESIRSGGAPLERLDIARWLVALVGPDAAHWMVPPENESVLAGRFLDLSALAEPEAWTREEIAGRMGSSTEASSKRSGPALWVELGAALGGARPSPEVLARAELEIAEAPPVLATELASALMRRGAIGRAFAAVKHAGGDEATLLRAEIARRRGDVEGATTFAREATKLASTRARAHALLARLAWDRGDLAAASTEAEAAESSGPAAAEVNALIAYAQEEYARGLMLLEGVDASGLGRARLDGTRGMLEHARGDARASVAAFQRAVDHASEAGAVVEEATYLTGLAAAAVDAGATAVGLSSSTRAALLWERLGRDAMAARAHLSRAAAFAMVGATHEATRAAEEARRRGDARAAVFARWAMVEARAPGDPVAAREALAAYEEFAPLDNEDTVRALARVLVYAPNREIPLASFDARVNAMSAATRWEWWGARAATSFGTSEQARVVAEIIALLDVSAPLASRGPALAAAVKLARAIGDGEGARRIEAARRVAAQTLREGAPPEYRAALSSVAWLDGIADDDERTALGAGQVGELESIVRALSSRDRLKPLLEQVLDTMVLWTGVERGLLLLRAPDGKLAPRAARNLARHDLGDEQLALSTGLAQRAIAERRAVLATDAFAQVGDLHASVHALGLRSVLAVPLVARGDVLGVVYLDDRVRRGAFGPGELAWVRLVASQAALAIADARDQALLRRAVRRAERANARLAAELGQREAELATARAETRFRYDEIIGRSEPMRAMLKLVDRVTMSDVPVLLIGESGTGKELVARAIHANGLRSARPFVSENCGSVPDTLLESTLFGHVRGAFTGASATRAGLFDVADRGTLFLDEIGEMPLTMQTKLLRVLQNGEVRPVGGERSRTVDVRIIGATHRDLDAMVAAGTFREDLFYRLNVVSIRIPPLRERREDIPLLANRFVAQHGAGRKVKLTRAALDRLSAFPWPGNVRQLENELRRALVLADDRIDVSELSDEVGRGGPGATRDAGVGLKARVDALETDLVKDALVKTKGNQTRAAELLGVSRFGLQKMMRRLGIKAP